MVHRYVTGEDPAVRDGFEGPRRGYYKLDEQEEEGRIGPVRKGKDSAASAAYSRQLFKACREEPPGGVIASACAMTAASCSRRA